MRSAIRPVQPGARPTFIRLTHPRAVSSILADLQQQGILRSARAAGLLAVFLRTPSTAVEGTYRVGAAMSARQILNALASPVHQKLRLPEHFWAARTGALLERNYVCSADDYMADVRDPKRFTAKLPFKVDAPTLEGYLYPDTYDLPPLTNPDDIVTTQLAAFDEKVYEPLGRPKNLKTVLTKASLVELEVKLDEERPIVASVIENRLKRHMPLQIDASLNYGLGVWRPLKLSDYRTVPGPYNLYRHAGLPPGPICSPSVKSIEAVLKPAKTDYLFYVALPDGHSLFAKTYADHLKNIAKRKAAIAERKARGTS